MCIGNVISRKTFWTRHLRESKLFEKSTMLQKNFVEIFLEQKMKIFVEQKIVVGFISLFLC